MNLLITRVLLFTFLYLSCVELYHNIVLIKSIYEKTIHRYSDEYKHTSYIYDCLYATCYPEHNYLKCKCLLE